MSWSTSELRVRLARNETGLSPPVKYFYWPFKGGTSIVDHLCYLCLMFAILSRLFIAALWSPEGKGLTSWLLIVMFIVILFLSLLVSWDRCGTWLYRFLILAVLLMVWSPAGKWLTSSPLIVMFVCFVTFPCGILGQVWYLILSIPYPSVFLTLIRFSNYTELSRLWLSVRLEQFTLSHHCKLILFDCYDTLH